MGGAGQLHEVEAGQVGQLRADRGGPDPGLEVVATHHHQDRAGDPVELVAQAVVQVGVEGAGLHGGRAGEPVVVAVRDQHGGGELLGGAGFEAGKGRAALELVGELGDRGEALLALGRTGRERDAPGLESLVARMTRGQRRRRLDQGQSREAAGGLRLQAQRHQGSDRVEQAVGGCGAKRPGDAGDDLGHVYRQSRAVHRTSGWAGAAAAMAAQVDEHQVAGLDQRLPHAAEAVDGKAGAVAHQQARAVGVAQAAQRDARPRRRERAGPQPPASRAMLLRRSRSKPAIRL